jgi:YVTN family beta-propeller protein
VGGGSLASVYEFNFSPEGKLTPARTFELVSAAQRTHEDFTGDVTLSPDERLIYVAMVHRDTIAVINPQSGRVIERIKTGRRPYKILFHPDGQSFLVSCWADAAIYHHKAESGERISVTRTGAHPTDMVLSGRQPSEKDEIEQNWKYRLFVAAANTNRIYVLGIDENKGIRQIETINVALFADQPAGMTPAGLALDPEQKKLYAACSDANAVAVVDIDEARSEVEGFVPSGWYPTAARVMADGRLLIFNGRGSRSFPNPQGPNPAQKPNPVHQGQPVVEYVGRLQLGSISVVPPFDERKLNEYTGIVRRNTPYRDRLLQQADVPAGNPVPARPGDPSPIEHVIYVVKENRTYDQVFGDLGKGNGEPSLTLFDEKSTPNHRKLAKEYVLFDNFYVNADVSADGHNWSTSAIANDYVQKMWPNSYGGRRRHYDYEGGEPAAYPPAGYIWSNAAAAGISLRNYGWWGVNTPTIAPAGSPQVTAVKDPVLARSTNMNYRGFDMDYTDVDRIRVFLKDLAEFERTGVMPKLMFVRIGNDHTSGLASGKYSPFAAMADNDLALGQLVEALSKSRFWTKTAVFVLEDDAQNGPDHVDSHRSPAFIISPYTRRGIVDSTHYNTAAMLRTMELILGLKPMTHFDAAAMPMWNAFSPKPDAAPYTAVIPRQDLNERNPGPVAAAQGASLAARSERMDFSEADRIDDDELNDILWRAIKKTDPPAPTRSIFGR